MMEWSKYEEGMGEEVKKRIPSRPKSVQRICNL
jgi:hypothetical protein